MIYESTRKRNRNSPRMPTPKLLTQICDQAPKHSQYIGVLLCFSL